MHRFKKRLRLLVEKLGGVLEYRDDDSIDVRFNTGSIRISSLSYDTMQCDLKVGDAAFPVRAPKVFVFDIVSRLAAPHLAPLLRNYTHGSLLTLQDYIDNEQGGSCMETLHTRIVDDPSITHSNLGGNRILAEYYHGVLILCDDLCDDATNVIELSLQTGG